MLRSSDKRLVIVAVHPITGSSRRRRTNNLHFRQDHSSNIPTQTSHRKSHQNTHQRSSNDDNNNSWWITAAIPASLLALWYAHKHRKRAKKSEINFKEIKPSAVLIPRCKACGLPIDFQKDKYIVQFGANIHSNCLKCAVCEKRQTAQTSSGAWTFWKQRSWTGNDQNKQIFHAAQSGKMSYYSDEEFRVQLSCLNHYVEMYSPNCSVCSKRIVGRTDISFYPSGEVFCKHHESSIQKSRLCYNCSRSELFEGCQPMLDSGPPSQLTCKKCREIEGIISSPKALAICCDIVLLVLSELGLDLKNFEFVVELRPQEWFESFVPPKFSYPHYEGITIKRDEAFGLVRKCDIVIRWNLSVSHALLVIAHEFSHAYLHFHKIDDIPTEVEEDFCEMIAYLVMTTLLNNEEIIKRVFRGRQDPILTHLRRYRSTISNNIEPWENYILRNVRPNINLKELIDHLTEHKRLPQKTV